MGVGGEKAAHSIRLFWCFVFLAMAILCHARNHVSFSGNGETLMGWKGRSLKAVGLDDYGNPGANPEHDPRTRDSPGTSVSGSGRQTRTIPDTP